MGEIRLLASSYIGFCDEFLVADWHVRASHTFPRCLQRATKCIRDRWGMEQPATPETTFYFCPLKCRLTPGTFIRFSRVIDGQLEDCVGLVLQVSNQLPRRLLICQFVKQAFLHSLFPAFADVYFVKDPNKELIETDLTLWIDSHEVTGLAFVFKHLFISRSVQYVFTSPLVYNSTPEFFRTQQVSSSTAFPCSILHIF